MPDPSARMSVVMVAGACRRRSQYSLDRLCAQKRVGDLEIVVVDLAAGSASPLSIPPGAPVRIIAAGGLEHWGEARRLGFEQTSAPVVAFIEEHCFTDPDWAAALIDAHQQPWASVGYAFRNANPQTYVSRAAMMTDYGQWLEPVRRGPVSWLPGNNVSYKREAFLSLDGRLEDAFATDFVAHEAFRQRGLPMFVESKAVAHHLNFSTVRETAYTNYVWCRAMAGRRVRAGGWSRARRIAQGLLTPATAPVFRLARLAQRMGGRRALWPQFLVAMPVLIAVSLCAGAGEAAGYLAGPGNAEAELKRWELDVERN